VDDLNLTGLLRALAASEAGSFAEAARRLGVSRQAVHRSVESLEARIGQPIFDRDGHGLRPTAVGRELLKHVEGLRAVERGVRGALASIRGEPAGVVRIATPPAFGDALLAPAVVRLTRRWPALRFHVRAESRRTELVADDYDVMVRIGAAPPDGHFARLLGHAALVLCGTPDRLAASGVLEEPGQLRGVPLLEYGPRRSIEWGFSRGHESVAVAVDPLLSADSAPLVLEACLAGIGILRAPELVVRTHLHSGRLVPVLGAWQLPSAEVWAIYGHRSASDPTLAALLDELHRAFVAPALA
jgi:DNA-binding transcriptional LysR family regulator